MIGETWYKKEFDFGISKENPRLTYMVAIIPRSGSTWCVIEMWKTGCLGALLEYLNIDDNMNIIKRFAGRDLLEYWNKLRRLRTDLNGLFGYKMIVPNYVILATKYKELLSVVAPDRYGATCVDLGG